MSTPSTTGTPGTTPAARRILVVEDDESIAMGLEMNLSAEGYTVDIANNGEDGLARASSGGFDLVILDVMLPKMNGLEVLRALRGKKDGTPVIMLSARGAEMDKVVGLELGAEDYITKPFGLAELLARVKAVLRRGGATPSVEVDPVVIGDIEVDPTTREVRRAGKAIDLTATEFDILYFLLSSRNRVLTREQIQTGVWGENHHGTTRTIDNFILQLRQKLERDPQHPRYIVTVRGVGYRFIPLRISALRIAQVSVYG